MLAAFVAAFSIFLSAVSLAMPPDGTSSSCAKDVANQPTPTGGEPTSIGKYKIRRKLGSGGQAIVYLAEHPEFVARMVAIKLTLLSAIPTELHPDVIEQIRQQASALVKLDHSNILHIFDLDFHHGNPFEVLEYVAGADLEQYSKSFTIPEARAVDWVSQLAYGLASAHASGIIHRDIKPANILIDENSVPRLTDFGMAFVSSFWRTGSANEDVLRGTPAFMSPEQARAEPTEPVTDRSDVFSLGAVLYRLITKENPYHLAQTPLQALQLALNCQFDRDLLSKAPASEALKRILLRAMECEPRKRFTAFEFAEALATLQHKPALHFVQSAAKWAAIPALALTVLASTLPLWRSDVSVVDPPNTNQPTLHSESEVRPPLTIYTSILRGEDTLDLSGAVPVRKGDELQIIITAEKRAQTALFWLDSAGNLHSASLVAKNGNPDGVFIYPGPGSGDYVAITRENPGTNFIFAVSDWNKPPTLAEVRKIVGDKPLPPIPPATALEVKLEGVRPLSDRGGPGAISHHPLDPGVAHLEKLAAALVKRFGIVEGVAFSQQ